MLLLLGVLATSKDLMATKKNCQLSTHTPNLSYRVFPSADETLMIMMMSNDHHYTTLMQAGSHFPPCSFRALS